MLPLAIGCQMYGDKIVWLISPTEAYCHGVFQTSEYAKIQKRGGWFRNDDFVTPNDSAQKSSAAVFGEKIKEIIKYMLVITDLSVMTKDSNEVASVGFLDAGVPS